MSWKAPRGELGLQSTVAVVAPLGFRNGELMCGGEGSWLCSGIVDHSSF